MGHPRFKINALFLIAGVVSAGSLSRADDECEKRAREEYRAAASEDGGDRILRLKAAGAALTRAIKKCGGAVEYDPGEAPQQAQIPIPATIEISPSVEPYKIQPIAVDEAKPQKAKIQPVKPMLSKAAQREVNKRNLQQAVRSSTKNSSAAAPKPAVPPPALSSSVSVVSGGGSAPAPAAPPPVVVAPIFYDPASGANNPAAVEAPASQAAPLTFVPAPGSQVVPGYDDVFGGTGTWTMGDPQPAPPPPAPEPHLPIPYGNGDGTVGFAGPGGDSVPSGPPQSVLSDGAGNFGTAAPIKAPDNYASGSK